jgi:hypothetical protein
MNPPYAVQSSAAFSDLREKRHMFERRSRALVGCGRRSRICYAFAAALVTVVALTCRPSQIAGAAQVPGPQPSAPASSPPQARSDQDLITRYRFSERYGTSVEVSEEKAVGQYRVAINEHLSEAVEETDKNGKVISTAPPVTIDQVMVYTDRPAEVSTLGQVKSLMRRYEKVVVSAGGETKTAKPASVEGLTIWYRPQVDDLPLVICMTKDRTLLESDYKFAWKQLFVPSLINILPPTPLRIGDTWPLSKMGVKILVGGETVAQGGLLGKLVEIRSTPGSPNRVAVLDVSGRIVVMNGVIAVKMGVRAQIEFSFQYKAPGNSATGTTKEDATVDARGSITRLSLGISGTSLSSIDKKQRDVKRELVLDRELVNTGVPLTIPREPPKPTQENTWLTYVDPKRRFYFRHPQELYQPSELGLPSQFGPEKVELVHLRLGVQGADHVVLEYLPDSQRPPEEVRTANQIDWKSKGIDVLQGSYGWQPEEDWPGMKVYRYESAIVVRGRGNRGVDRIHQDGYVAHLTRDASLIVEATTAVDPPIQLRRDVEAMLKTFQVGKPKLREGER